MNWLQKLITKEEKLIIGLMSGTSMDGIDVIISRVSGFGTNTKAEIIEFNTFNYSPELQSKLTNLNKGITLKDISDINFLVGEEFALAAQKLIDISGLKNSDIDLIGSHGQTVFHNPPSNNDFVSSTLQIGELDVICEITGITTVGDFRTKDLALGGEGAPLIPYLDYILFSGLGKNIIAQNIGGISNCTFVSENPDELIAFDSGPGNSLIDAVINLYSNGEKLYDKDSEFSLSGQVDNEILKELMNNPYFSKVPPKSTGKEEFGMLMAKELFSYVENGRVNINDLLATLAEFSSKTIYESYEKFIFNNHEIDEVIISGGGAYNKDIINRLKQKLSPIALKFTDEYKVPVDAKEALGFAILANEAISGNCSNVPKVTGAKKATILGKISISSGNS